MQQPCLTQPLPSRAPCTHHHQMLAPGAGSHLRPCLPPCQPKDAPSVQDPCTRPPSGHHLVQVRRNTHCDVIRAADLAPLYPITGIQTYSINCHRVIFLQPRPNVK
jgi:hypothetical protein